MQSEDTSLAPTLPRTKLPLAWLQPYTVRRLRDNAYVPDEQVYQIILEPKSPSFCYDDIARIISQHHDIPLTHMYIAGLPFNGPLCRTDIFCAGAPSTLDVYFAF